MRLPTQVEASQPRAGESVAQLPVGKTLNVATRVIPPFVIQQGTELSGFSIDLWRSLAAEMGVQSKFQIYPNVSKLLDAVAVKKVDLGIAAISISAERERKFDFSQPIFSGGLQIMVRDPRSGGTAVNSLKNIFTSTLPQLVGLALLMVVILIPAMMMMMMVSTARFCFLGFFSAAN
jgi:polar amino acid transport system substrate-binding protein